jgi:hypothetical protein
VAHAVHGMVDECAGEIATRLHIYDNRSCAHAPPISASPKIPVGSARHTSYTVTVIRASVQYCSHVWSTLLIPLNEGENYRVGPVSSW